MTIARWEYWSVAKMLIATHGDGAELKARMTLEEARLAGQASEVIVWSAIVDKLAEISAEEREGEGDDA